MNKRHPFGLPIWKPALYKKSRSVVRKANSALHSSPSSSPELFLNPGNILWLLVFGWWLAIVMFALSILLMLVPPDGYSYGLVMRELAFYLLWPFGRYVERHIDERQQHILSTASTRNSGIYSNDAASISSSLLDQSDDEEVGLLHGRKGKEKQRSLKDSIKDTILLGPAGWIYYLLYFTIVGKCKARKGSCAMQGPLTFADT